MKWHVLAGCGVLACLAVVSVSCSLPITPAILSHVKDTTPPTIIILSPANGSPYAAKVLVEGRVTDVAQDGGSGKVVSLSYEVASASLEDLVPFSGDGSFSFNFSTANLSGSITVSVAATDWNGNSSEATITLTDAGALSSFVVSPGNKQAGFTWSSVAYAGSYSLYNLRYGEIRDGVTSPCAWTDLGNGLLYSFQLQAHSTEGGDNWSPVIEVIPLAPSTLAPHVVAEYGQLTVDWPAIPAVDEYVLLRSTSMAGPFNVRTITRSTTFTDATVSTSEDYFYQVRPIVQDSIISDINGGQASAFPPTRSPSQWAIVGSLATGPAWDVALSGHYAYIADTQGLSVIDVSNPANPFLAGSKSIGGLSGTA
jgi:hypothetical protein